jgi:pimeloyl-ACP methyl ester carboxylesterase
VAACGLQDGEEVDGMALIVMVHGAFNELWGPRELHARWVPALRDGLWHAGGDVDPAQVDVCFYGDLFRHDPEAGDGPDEATRAGIADMLHETVGDDALEVLSQAAGKATFERTVDMVTTMVTTPDLRERVQQRVHDAIGPDTRIVVAHSLGTLVSYNYLVAHPESPVRTLITLGSPLGSPLVAGQALTRGDDGLAVWPGAIEHWVNVAAVRDLACDEPRLATVFGERVEDRLVDNGHRPHDPQPYLNNRVTGAAVLEAIARG